MGGGFQASWTTFLWDAKRDFWKQVWSRASSINRLLPSAGQGGGGAPGGHSGAWGVVHFVPDRHAIRTSSRWSRIRVPRKALFWLGTITQCMMMCRSPVHLKSLPQPAPRLDPSTQFPTPHSCSQPRCKPTAPTARIASAHTHSNHPDMYKWVPSPRFESHPTFPIRTALSLTLRRPQIPISRHERMIKQDKHTNFGVSEGARGGDMFNVGTQSISVGQRSMMWFWISTLLSAQTKCPDERSSQRSFVWRLVCRFWPSTEKGRKGGGAGGEGDGPKGSEFSPMPCDFSSGKRSWLTTGHC